MTAWIGRGPLFGMLRRGARQRWWAIAFVLSSAAAAGQCPEGSQFLDPKKLSDTGGHVLQASVGIHLAFSVYVAWTAGSQMFLDKIGIRSSFQIGLFEQSVGSGDPAIVTDTTGTTYIVMTQDDPVFVGREVFLISNRGGGFTRAPENVSQHPGDDYAPRIYLDGAEQPHLAWAQEQGRATRVIYRPPGGPPRLAAAGDYPTLAVDREGTVHLLYSSSRDLFALQIDSSGTAAEEVRVTRTPFDDEFFPSIAPSEGGRVLLAYEMKGGLYHQLSSDGGRSFGPPRLLDSGGIGTPEFRVSRDLLSVIYEKQGDLYYILGKVGSDLWNPCRILHTPGVETRPSMALDTRGNLHVSFISDGEVYYTNNTMKLTAEFTSINRQGEAPLEVKFADVSSGDIRMWWWDFGDGSPLTTGRNPSHIYTHPGKYSVTLEVFGIGIDARVEKTNHIFVQTPSNRLWIPDQLVIPGQEKVWYPVMAAHKDPLQGFQIAGTFDPNVLHLREITYQGTALHSARPEFFKSSFSNEPAGAYFFVPAILELDPPFSRHVIPPSDGHRLVHLIFDCSPDAPQGGTTLVELRNGLGADLLDNVFVVNGLGPLPSLESSVTTILELSEPLPRFFKRGDVDGNQEVDLSDAFAILTDLFRSGNRRRCPDAADVDDDGAINIADSIGLLGFMFLGGDAPAVPFPNPGLDPTEDNHSPCAE